MKVTLFIAFYLLAFVHFNYADERSHSYEDLKLSISDGIDSIIDQLTNSEHVKDDYEDEFGFDGLDGSDFGSDLGINDKHKNKLQFFMLHDYDKNNYLDGNELMKSMTHEHGDHSTETSADVAARIQRAQDAVEVMMKHDLDQDGLLTFAEFIYSQ